MESGISGLMNSELSLKNVIKSLKGLAFLALVDSTAVLIALSFNPFNSSLVAVNGLATMKCSIPSLQGGDDSEPL